FTEATLRDGPWDVIISTEVIEHLEAPPAFLRLMRQAIAEDGILLLTTPNADWITPALSSGELYALLAPGAHVVLQSAQSLKMALEAAGFAHVVVRAEDACLVAYASPAPFTLAEDFASRRAVYRRYLEARAAAAAPGSDLQIGFAGRGLFDAVNDQDKEGAQTAWAVLNAATQARFGYGLEGLAALPPGAENDSLEGLAQKMPLGLGMMLFSRSMQRLAAGEDRQAVRPMLELARAAIAALQAALDQRSLGRDRLCVSIDSVAAVELLLCDAEAGRPEVVGALLGLGDKIAGWRGFVALVNAGAYEAAARLREALLGDVPDASIPAGLRRDALLSLANFHLAPGQDAVQALKVADELSALGESANEIRLGVFVRLVNGGRYDEARDFIEKHDVAVLAARAGGEAARDASLAQAVLDLAVGDPAEVPTRLDGVVLDPLHRETLLLEAFIRLVNAGRYEEADAFAVLHDVATLAARTGGEVARNVGLSEATLDLQGDRLASGLQRLVALETERGVPEQTLAGLYAEAFVRAVNAGELLFARELEQQKFTGAWRDLCSPDQRMNILVAGLYLELRDGGDAARIPERLNSILRAGAGEEREKILILAAFTALVNKQEQAKARQMLPLAEPLIMKFSPPYSAEARDALFSAGILFLQEKQDWPRSVASFARLRDSLEKQTPACSVPEPLFWPALRGEVLALHKLNRGAEAEALLTGLVSAYPDAPDDLRVLAKAV
ncbi:MAG TPA: class I SAM-dependent methyltransferase, partial [Acidocella sp.]|nr:class I SAM-dependent methyltransferase [Acidocella sp.]